METRTEPGVVAEPEGLRLVPGSALANVSQQGHPLHCMKSSVPLLILVAACLALLFALLATRRQATVEREEAVNEGVLKDLIIMDHSNNWQNTSIALVQVQDEKTGLEQELSSLTSNYTTLSNTYLNTTSILANTEVILSETEAALQFAEGKIADLEGQNEALDQKTMDLNASLAALGIQIVETERQLEMAEGDKAILQAELEQLMADKAELERQLNDLDVLRKQIRQLRSDLAVSRRLEWVRRGILGAGSMKGATRQMQVSRQSAADKQKKSKEPQYDLNVEILEDGSVRVIPQQTNAPAGATNSN